MACGVCSLKRKTFLASLWFRKKGFVGSNFETVGAKGGHTNKQTLLLCIVRSSTINDPYGLLDWYILYSMKISMITADLKA